MRERNLNNFYYFITTDLNVEETIDMGWNEDGYRFKIGNYFNKKQEAKKHLPNLENFFENLKQN
jgi:hypothetical protein